MAAINLNRVNIKHYETCKNTSEKKKTEHVDKKETIMWQEHETETDHNFL